MNQQQFLRNRIINDSHLYHRDTMKVIYGPPRYDMNNLMNLYALYPNPNAFYQIRGSNQPMMTIQPTYAYVQDNHFIHHENINHVPVRWFDSNLERRQYGRSIRNVLPTYADVQENNINQVPIRREIIPTHRWYGTNRETNQQRLNTRDVFSVDSETMTCLICLEELLVGSRAIQLSSPCLHVYHEDCILKWLDISSTCPLCRRNVG